MGPCESPNKAVQSIKGVAVGDITGWQDIDYNLRHCRGRGSPDGAGSQPVPSLMPREVGKHLQRAGNLRSSRDLSCQAHRTSGDIAGNRYLGGVIWHCDGTARLRHCAQELLCFLECAIALGAALILIGLGFTVVGVVMLRLRSRYSGDCRESAAIRNGSAIAAVCCS